ncbi:D-glycerate dehydrogenase [Erythrobacter sp. SCSIO 43205]|uniref:2-hydroxyacid dehydrogenase n=1 Tax=Erythrobacter sp. SCSIO 43205 TaxID=2779361 RepID=UPI001CA9298F|nr:D-glycerate dehydrogenase [Erythrobacter sp. SCSIO 43205]UAB77250.1 D-glycerate dehydrogenase [Erythrobacter sp. SCSIO 43205]
MSDHKSPPQFASRKPKVVVTRHLAPAVEARMSELYDTTLNESDQPMTRDQLIEAMATCDVMVPTVTDRIDADMIESAGENLRLIANFGAGTEHIDLKAAASRKIIVTNTPGVFTDDTADLTMVGIIGVPRRIREGVELIRSGEWTGWAPTGMLGRKIGGKVLGIIGMGRIGQAVAHRARAFGMEIAYYGRRQLPEAMEKMLSARYVDTVDALVAEADILTLHCPLTEETRGLIDERRLGLMKPGSCIVNTARGEIIDQEALIAALQSGHLAGAGLDVYPAEPLVDPRLIRHPNVMTLPHLGSATVEGREASGEKVIANIRFWADGHRPPDQVLTALVGS